MPSIKKRICQMTYIYDSLHEMLFFDKLTEKNIHKGLTMSKENTENNIINEHYLQRSFIVIAEAVVCLQLVLVPDFLTKAQASV